MSREQRVLIVIFQAGSKTNSKSNLIMFTKMWCCCEAGRWILTVELTDWEDQVFFLVCVCVAVFVVCCEAIEGILEKAPGVRPSLDLSLPRHSSVPPQSWRNSRELEGDWERKMEGREMFTERQHWTESDTSQYYITEAARHANANENTIQNKLLIIIWIFLI